MKNKFIIMAYKWETKACSIPLAGIFGFRELGIVVSFSLSSFTASLWAEQASCAVMLCCQSLEHGTVFQVPWAKGFLLCFWQRLQNIPLSGKYFNQCSLPFSHSLLNLLACFFLCCDELPAWAVTSPSMLASSFCTTQQSISSPTATVSVRERLGLGGSPPLFL